MFFIVRLFGNAQAFLLLNDGTVSDKIRAFLERFHKSGVGKFVHHTDFARNRQKTIDFCIALVYYDVNPKRKRFRAKP